METLKLGVQEATEAIVISKAINKLQCEQKLTPAQAIDFLTSSLTTMKLLGRVESQIDAMISSNNVVMTTSTSTSKLSSLLVWKQPLQSQLDNSGSTTFLTTTTSSSSSSSASHNLIKKMNKATKNNRKRQQEKDNEDEEVGASHMNQTKNVNTKAAQKVTQSQSNNTVDSSTSSSRVKPPSPKVTREKRDLDSVSNSVPTQSVPKRQRLDSI